MNRLACATDPGKIPFTFFLELLKCGQKEKIESKALKKLVYTKEGNGHSYHKSLDGTIETIGITCGGLTDDFIKMNRKHRNATHFKFGLGHSFGEKFEIEDKYVGIFPSITHFSCKYETIKKLSEKEIKAVASLFPNLVSLKLLDEDGQEIKLPLLENMKFNRLFLRKTLYSLKDQCAFLIYNNNIPTSSLPEDLKEKYYPSNSNV
ncbi:MAG: hypothetical protein QM652_02185 [Legionella sp.]|uniref:hypothetical protein n=1 Tax=Legionella sp. TaxID=459 RepID=UPI0039E57CE5